MGGKRFTKVDMGRGGGGGCERTGEGIEERKVREEKA